MVVVSESQRFRSHANAFGFLRLLFASLVIVSHTPEMVDGNRHRELLSRIFGTISFGEFAVDGFFIISGFLITGSYLSSRSIRDYLIKRVARIYPGFVVASLLSVFVAGPLSGAAFAHPLQMLGMAIVHALLLDPAYLPDSFPGTPFPLLNNPMWTIRYEFFCYLLVIPLAGLGVLRRPVVLAALAAVCFVKLAVVPPPAPNWGQHLPPFVARMIGDPLTIPRLAGLFVAGAALYGLQYRLPIMAPRRIWWALGATIGLLLCLNIGPLAHFGMASFGGYLILAAAAAGGGSWLRSVNDRNDISYGIYLYAWPIEKLLVWWGISQSLVLLGLMTWGASILCGWLSWVGIERPIMRRVRPARRAPSAP